MELGLGAEQGLLDRYELLRTLGEGGYGAVHEARDRRSGERIALKELTQVSAANLARFKQEFRAVQEVNHPNLARLDALFEDRGKWWIAMELVEGNDLLAHLYSADRELGFDDAQLRDAFCQLCDALAALHAAGLVHRDLKPTNVLVTSAGRVVLLDFGLATAVETAPEAARVAPLGTLAYMAPEQVAGGSSGPAADWYAFGVCLYEALTGFLPLDAETPFELLRQKQHAEAPLASSQVSGIPNDLDRLCAGLLARSPEARPGASEMRRMFAQRGTDRPAEPATASLALGDARAFEGRERELERLAHASAATKRGEAQVVLVEGESGIGKTTLVDRFLGSLAGRSGEPLVLRSRCYENELSAFKAFDGAMDTLARALARLDSAVVEALMPANAALLPRLFPAFAALQVVANARARPGLTADPAAQRLEAFSALARLLARVAERRPLVLVIDDLQWADAESFRLLRSLVTGPQPLPALLLATARPRSELEGEALEAIDALRALPCTHVLQLTGLPHASAVTLARALLGSDVAAIWLEAIVHEAAGHPLFLTLLADAARKRDPSTAHELTLDAAIAARLAELPETARELVETAAVLGSPLAAQLLGRAAGLRESDVAGQVARLCEQRLLRRRRAGEIACFHDRIRAVAVAGLGQDRARALHARIARVLEAHGTTDPAELGRHYEAAGEAARAFEAYRLAAESASAGLAFARAAVLYERALRVATAFELAPAASAALRGARGHALARAGRSADAAREFLAAADTAEGEDRTRLRIWAAQHLLQSAHVAAGMDAARALLGELGLGLPSSTAGALGRLLWDRACLRVRGLEVGVLEGPIATRSRMRLDALWGVAMPVAWLDPLASAALSTRHLRLARALGEPMHMARALAEESFARTLQDPDDASADGLLARARELALPSGDPALEVSIAFREATVATFRWQLARARDRLEHALQVCTERCPDQPWLLTNVRTNLGSILISTGEHARIEASLSEWLAEARDREDQFALTMLEALAGGSLRHLMADKPDVARACLRAALEPWPEQPFSFAHFGELVSIAYIELYRGGEGGAHWLERERPRLGRAVLLKTGMSRAAYLLFEALTALCAHGVSRGERAAALLDRARRDARALRASKSALGSINAIAIDAQLALLDRQPELALQLAREARARAEACGYAMLARSVQYLEGKLEGGDAGAAKCEGALRFFAEQGWSDPRRAVAVMCPVSAG